MHARTHLLDARWLALAALCALPHLAFAQDAQVFTGGVGDEDLATIQQTQKDYALKVIFAGKGGVFLSDVDVKITDSKGKDVVSVTTEGPVLLAKLKPGKYTIVSKSIELTDTQKFTITGKSLRIVYVRFPVED